MLTLYKKAAFTFLGLLVLSLVVGWICLDRFFVDDALLPSRASSIPWSLEVMTDAFRGGKSSLTVLEGSEQLEYKYILTEDIPFPYVMAVLAFADLESAEHLLDLSHYLSASFQIRCSQSNVMTFYVHSYDEQITDPANFYTYRLASALFSCNESGSEVEIDLKHLDVPQWWLEITKSDLSDRSYWLAKVLALSFDASSQGPTNIPVEVIISDLHLHGRDWRFVNAYLIFLLFIWLGYFAWFFRFYIANLISNVKDQLKSDNSLHTYEQKPVVINEDKDSGSDAERKRVLEFMATEYANPKMNLEFATGCLGMSRARINTCLKAELGCTFSMYLNKLRLAEAARLLTHKREASVAEIAYSLGFKNVTYFNKLFKQAFGCSPRLFKDNNSSSNVD